jgi:hypothetical protein
MKTYTKLPLPKVSGFKSNRLYRKYVPWKLRKFFSGVKNVFRWMPTIYKDKDFDDYFITKLLQKKIENQREFLVKNNSHYNIDTDNFWMTVVLNLIEREHEEYYGMEYIDYLDEQLMFSPIGNDLFEMNSQVSSERLSEYLEKYPSSTRKVAKRLGLSYSNTNELSLADKRSLAFRVSSDRQTKCRNLLFEILKVKSSHWWD